MFSSLQTCVLFYYTFKAMFSFVLLFLLFIIITKANKLLPLQKNERLLKFNFDMDNVRELMNGLINTNNREIVFADSRIMTLLVLFVCLFCLFEHGSIFISVGSLRDLKTNPYYFNILSGYLVQNIHIHSQLQTHCVVQDFPSPMYLNEMLHAKDVI